MINEKDIVPGALIKFELLWLPDALPEYAIVVYKKYERGYSFPEPLVALYWISGSHKGQTNKYELEFVKARCTLLSRKNIEQEEEK